MQITNTSGGTLTLPSGVELRHSASVDVTDAEWKQMAAHPVVKAWVGSKMLAVAAPSPTPAKTGGKTDGKTDSNPLA